MSKPLLKLAVALIVLSSVITPTERAYAVPESVIGSGAQAAIDAAIKAAGAVPAVPTTDTVQATKEVKLCMWGICIPGLDKIAITITKQVLERMVDSTVEWINGGFDNGNPAYVTDPKQYFTDLADGVAGEFIGDITSKGTPLDFLCSPFKAQVKLALKTQYEKTDPFQCTLTGIGGNIDGFFSDFTQGGWESWFSMTQNNTNNPYGAYIEAKVELDSRLANALGIEDKQLDWGKGFLSYQPCVVHEDVYSRDPNGNVKRAKGKCLIKGPIQTPGTAIESGLENVLGTGIRQLELADEFDELVGALISRVLQDTVLGAKGLLNAKKVASEEAPLPKISPDNQCVGPALPPRSGTLPVEVAVVQAVAAEFPQYLQNSCLSSGGSWQFMDEVVRRLNEKDPRWGYNGKRGNTNDLSQDAISYYGGSGSASTGERDVHVVDIISGHCGPNPAPAWQDVTNETLQCGVTGAYVYPRDNRGAAIPSAPPTEPSGNLQ